MKATWGAWNELDMSRFEVGGGALIVSAKGRSYAESSPLTIMARYESYLVQVTAQIEDQSCAALAMEYTPQVALVIECEREQLRAYGPQGELAARNWKADKTWLQIVNGKNPAVLHQQARILVALGRVGEAKAAVRRLARLAPGWRLALLDDPALDPVWFDLTENDNPVTFPTPLTGRSRIVKTDLPMKAKFPRKQTSCLWLVVLVLASPAWTHAQDPFPTPTPTPDPLAGVPVQVIDQQQVTVGTHTITYNRIVPPVFPAATPTPAPQATPITKTTNRSPQTQAKKMTRSTQSSGAGDGGEKPYKMLLLSATVYDHQFTEVRWPDGIEPALRAYVNLDFCYFTTVTNLETADTVYDLMFAWSNDTVASLTQAGQQPPNLAAFPAGRSSYQIIAGDANAHPDALAAFDALCIYFDANKAQMVAAYNQREADNAAHQQWLLDHPPVQPDTVMYFWPVKGSAYLNQTH